jgi:hypothetical protein
MLCKKKREVRYARCLFVVFTEAAERSPAYGWDDAQGFPLSAHNFNRLQHNKPYANRPKALVAIASHHICTTNDFRANKNVRWP